MLTDDQKAHCMKEIQTAYQSFSFYEELKEKGELPKDFNQTTFSIVGSVLSEIAKSLQIQSVVQEQITERSKKSREMNKRIRELEEQLGGSIDSATYKENVGKIMATIERKWTIQGFSGVHEAKISESGDIDIHLDLKPTLHSYDIIFEDDEDEQEKIFAEGVENFSQLQLNTFVSDDYEYILDQDRNKEKIKDLIQNQFPGAEIMGWNLRKHGDDFVLNNVNIVFTNLLLMEES